MNFAEIVGEFIAQNALIQLPESAENEIAAHLAAVFTELLQDDGTAKRTWRKRFCHHRKKSRRNRKNSRTSPPVFVRQQTIYDFRFLLFRADFIFLGYKSLRGGIAYLNFFKKN